MRLINCSPPVQWSVSVINIRNIVRSTAHSDANSTSGSVKTAFVDKGLVKVISCCIRLKGPLWSRKPGVLGAPLLVRYLPHSSMRARRQTARNSDSSTDQ
jgi:hypothetical protein